MRRIVGALIAIAVACMLVAGTFVAVVARLSLENSLRYSATEQPTEREIEEAQRIGQIANSLQISVGPLTAAALVAVVVILALLAFRWELRRA